MPSFDIISQVDRQEVKNAIEQANKEIANRYDFKGSDARIEQKELELSVYADDDFKLGQVMDVLRGRLAKRNVDVRALESGALEKISEDQEVLEAANRATQHMYFTNPIKKFEQRASGMFSTHPPTLDRINRLRELTGEQPLDPAEAAPLAGLD